MSLRVAIGGLGLGGLLVIGAIGNVTPAEAQGVGGEAAAHPLLTENEYRLVAEQSQKSAALRSERRRLRLGQLTARSTQARAEGNAALEAELAGVVARLEAGSPPISDEDRWSRNHGRRMMLRGLWNNYGKQLQAPAVVAEFDAHAWRMARLERAKRVTASDPDVARRERLVAEIDMFVAAESERHRARLGQLLSPRPAAPSAVSDPPEGVKTSGASPKPSSSGAAPVGATVVGAPSAVSSAGGPNP